MEVADIKHKIIYFALIWGVDPDKALYIFEKESNFNTKEVGDMDIICKRTGKPIRARGLAQLTVCYHPEISDTKAFNEDFAIQWSMPKMADDKLCKKEWTVCRWYSPKPLPNFSWLQGG